MRLAHPRKKFRELLAEIHWNYMSDERLPDGRIETRLFSVKTMESVKIRRRGEEVEEVEYAMGVE